MKNKFMERDFVQKIDQTFVRFRGKTYWARCAPGSEEIQLFKNHHAERPVLKVSGFDDDLDISSIPLGYFNSATHKAAMYITRNPVRKVKQGVSLHNTVCDLLLANDFRGIANESVFQDSVSEGFDGKYPSIPSAIAMIQKSSWYSVALCNNVSVAAKDKETCSVFFKKDCIGVYTHKTNILSIPNDHFSPMISKFVAKHRWIIE